ncbi:DMT family transporter (plasmid) [Chloroflexota bacterium]|nr:DMT family transporter [Chloroflexota bacterium]
MTLKSNSQKQLNRGFLVALSSAIVLSFTAILIRLISQNYQLPALILAYWREIFVALCLLPVLLIVKPALLKLEKRHLSFMVLFGLVLALFNMLWTLSVTLIGASVATVLVYCSGAFTAILGWWLLKESLGWQKIIAVILCLVGAVFVSGAAQPSAWEANALGIITGILSGLMYAFYSLIGRSATQRGINPWTALFYTFLFASFFMLVVNLIPGNVIPGTAATPAEMFLLGDRWAGWLLLLLLAAGPTLLGFGLYNVSLSMLPSSTTNLIVTIEPVFTAFTAFFLLKERLTAPELLGSGLILIALVILRLRKSPKNDL